MNAVRPVDPKWRKNKKKKKRKPEKKDFKPGEHQKCYRCNETGHFARNCPALNKTCSKCGFTGHLAVCCKTKNPKRPPIGRSNPNGAYQVEEELDQRDGYAFAVNDGNKTSGIVHLQQSLEGGVWMSSHGLNFRTFTNHVTFFSDFTNLMKLTSGFTLRPILLAIS